ncbi:GNAT family N-acetyltransferase [Saccharophagus sp. K07]|uniref:GNAT family N-acetyltransferase n=1 Tax=Saccharophagus sp. K07 TaxID=2283636 RepID=UPI0016529533|nr:GNAT family N-acetyltransferase [Saccharophagus sp. K07]
MIHVEQVSWTDKKDVLAAIRREVFIEEQKVPESEEWDQYDEQATHFLALEQSTNTAIGTVRFLPSGKITRMAVRQPYRRQGVGSELMTAVLKLAQQKRFAGVYLDAQISACDFYQRFGFEKEGQPFWDAGILHIRMVKDLAD